jgi:hypothetical protein
VSSGLTISNGSGSEVDNSEDRSSGEGRLSDRGDVATENVAVTSPSETPIVGTLTGDRFFHVEQMARRRGQ